jgi:hypothetical protein
MLQTLMDNNKQIYMNWHFLFTTKMFNNKSQCVRRNESTMDIKYASACVVHKFSFFLLIKWKLKVSREYTWTLILIEKINFDYATHVNGSKDNYGFICLTSYKFDVSCPVVNSTYALCYST